MHDFIDLGEIGNLLVPIAVESTCNMKLYCVAAFAMRSLSMEHMMGEVSSLHEIPVRPWHAVMSVFALFPNLIITPSVLTTRERAGKFVTASKQE